jgi:flagellar hook-associated protein 1 FlgK
MLDQRDQYITQLSQLMDVRVVPGNGDQVSVYTMSGVQLVGGSDAAHLSFNAQGTVTPNTQWNADPEKSTLGSITISYANGGGIDLVASGSIRSGAIAAYLELRDKSLVQAQTRWISSPPRWPVRCPTRRPAVLPRRPARRPDRS